MIDYDKVELKIPGVEDIPAAPVPVKLNRHQRRAQAARKRSIVKALGKLGIRVK
jgi:hypothetical protein